MKKLSPVEQKAGSKVLDELRKHTQGMMNDKMGNLKKVSVMSDSKEGLKEGLSKAEEMMDSKKGASSLTKSPIGEVFGKSSKEEDCEHEANPEEIETLEESADHEASESSDEEEMEHEDMDDENNTPKTPSEIDKLIDELMAKKASMMRKY